MYPLGDKLGRGVNSSAIQCSILGEEAGACKLQSCAVLNENRGFGDKTLQNSGESLPPSPGIGTDAGLVDYGEATPTSPRSTWSVT